jgi:hypothetical protein
MRLKLLLTGCVFLAAACGEANKVADTPPAPPPPPFNSDIDVDEVMVHVMDPQARAFWAGWGEVYDDKGVHDVSAKTEEQWKRVEDGAAAVVLATNTLMLPAYQRKPEADWMKLAKDVADLAMEGKMAAEAQDVSKMESIGGKLDVACDACHAAFRPVGEQLPDGGKAAPAKVEPPSNEPPVKIIDPPKK